MKKSIILGAIMLISFCGINHVFAQKERKTLRSITSSPKLSEINKMVTLDEDQQKQLEFLYEKYSQKMDSAITKIEDTKEASMFIYKTKKNFDIRFMRLLTEKQKKEYIRNIATPEIAEKTESRMYYLIQTENYTKEELEKFRTEIFNYLMREKYVYTTLKYNIRRQKENIAQLKKLEPQALKEANGLQKAKHQGKAYQDGFQW